MAVVTGQTLQAMMNSFKALFLKGLQKSGDWDKIAMECKSTGKGTVYSWLGAFPRMEKWVGARKVKSMKNNDYELKNIPFEATVGVARADIEDDNLGIYSPMMEQMGLSAVEHIDENVFQALPNGYKELCYDGKPFFSSEHPIAENEDGTGKASTFSNIINPTKTTGPAWFLMDAGKVIKPIIFQNRQNARFQVVTNPNNDTVFMYDEFRYGADARRAFGYTFPQLAVASKDTLNATNFNLAYEALLNMKIDGGRKLNTKATILVVPPSLRSAAVALIEKQNLANGESNTNYKIVDLLVTPFCEEAVVASEPEEGEGVTDTQ